MTSVSCGGEKTSALLVESGLLLIFWLGSMMSASGMEVGGPPVGGQFIVPVTSFEARKFSTVYRQQYDFSCGSAALASLLTFHYRDAVSERDVFVDMFAEGDQARIRREGFSMLDMKRYLERRGYRSNGFRVALEQLNVPAITIVNQKGYLHFVIIKASRQGEILVGDPSAGTRSIARADFEDMWKQGILFLIEDGNHHATQTYHAEAAWSQSVDAPLDEGIARDSLADFNLLRRGALDF
jgi:predicted double-glycine peptidase